MHFLKNKTIFTTIFASCLISLIVPFIALSYFATDLLYRESSATAKSNAFLFSDLISESVKNSLTSTASLITFAAQSLKAVNPKEHGAAEEIERIIHTFISSEDDIYVAWTILEPNVFDEKRFVREYQRENGAIVPFVEDLDIVLADKEEAHWYFNPLASKEIYFDNAGTYDYGSGTVGIFTISSPIIKNGETIGVIGMDIPRRHYYSFMDSFQQENRREIMMISKDGTVLYSSKNNYDDKNLFDLGLADKETILKATQTGSIYSSESYSPVFKKKSLIYIRPVNIENVQQQVFLYVDMPLDYLYANAKKIMWSIIGATGIAGILLCIGILLSTRSIAGDIKQLTSTAGEIAQGNYNINFAGYEDGQSKNEIALLRSSLKKMLGQLKQNIQEKEHFSQTLEQKIEERTHQLSGMTKEAEEAREKAEKATRLKTQFLANMSHEIRTPINAIIGMTAIALDSHEIERKNYCLGKITDASSHLLTVINDILDMSKIEANKLELSDTEFNFEKMIANIAGVLKFRIEEKQQRFSVFINDNIPPSLIADQQRLAQVITNLLSNAIKFTPDKGLITLNASKLTDNNGEVTVRIDVKDSGIGISQENQKQLFQSFQQADNSISRKFGGTGLGLAISKSIIALMGGEIWINSKEGEGAVFSFTFKAKEGAAKPFVMPENAKNIKILFADDIETESFTVIANKLGIQPDTVISADKAVNAVKAKSYDLVLVNPNMANLNFKMFKEIFKKSNPKGIITAIGVNMPGANNEAADMFIDRPFFLSSAAELITSALKGDKAFDNTRQPFKDKHLLLVEDVAINREIVISLLEDTGVKIDEAQDGPAALKMFSDEPDKYDLIFMDIHMPGMDGYQTTEKIRHLPFKNAKTIPIIAMTANVFKEDIEKSIASGMNDHLGKPIDISDVIVKLHKYLNV